MQHDFILLDRSGSMFDGGKWPEALNAINAYVKKLADDNVDTGVTLATFDKNGGNCQFEVIRDRIIPSTWNPVTNEDATPRGTTPLNDAVGRLVTLAGAGQYEKVAIIIMTDGYENASEELTVKQAKDLLDQCRAKGWQVIFLGANFDNATQAAAYGNAASQTAQVHPTKMGFAAKSLGATRSAYGLTGAAMTLSDAEKAELKQQQ